LIDKILQAGISLDGIYNMISGKYHGKAISLLQTKEMVLNQVTYQPNFTDWHYHGNPLFSFVLDGHFTERTCKREYSRHSGTLFFQNWQDAHANSSSKAHSIFYVELKKNWFEKSLEQDKPVIGHMDIQHPMIKVIFHQIYKEAKIGGPQACLAVEERLVRVFDLLTPARRKMHQTPRWVFLLSDILHDLPGEKLTLQDLAVQLHVHPGHLCRYFRKHFRCTISEYIRTIKVEKSLNLVRNSTYSLTDIAYLCGFADQSHFSRCFKEINHLSPFQYRQLLWNS
jgi:AraC family transcriptional regulator